jgi:hypothetical protein
LFYSYIKILNWAHLSVMIAKIRMAITGKGTGKSGGAGVITYVQISKENIFLLAIYNKADVANITDKDLLGRLKGLK